MLKEADVSDDQLRLLQWQISEWKNDLLMPEDAMAQATEPDAIFAARVYASY